MRIEYRHNELNDVEKEQVWKILCQCDEEFYPRLSARESSAQKKLAIAGEEKTNAAKPRAYFKEMIGQEFILAYEGESVVGFMTFKKNYTCEALKTFGESLYITTVCVRKDCRGKGIMNALYQHMEQEIPPKCGCKSISTRTWSLNEAQLYELSKRGYEKLAVLANDRGNGVDTIYFGLRTDCL